MSEPAPVWVEYPAADEAMPSTIVERVASEVVDDDFARGVIRAVRDAYLPQFGDKQVHASAIEKAFDPDDDKQVAKRRDIITERITTDEASYWVIRGDQPDKLAGLAKFQHDYRRTYLGDVVATPPWNRGLGSMLLHAPLRLSGYPADNTVELDGFVGSSVNEWYERLGFEPGYVNGKFKVGDTGQTLLMRHYVLPCTIGVGGLVQRLEARRPQLAQAKFWYSTGRKLSVHTT